MDVWKWLAVLLTVLFALYKLFGVITWSWWWVFSPIWFLVGFIIMWVFVAWVALVIMAISR